MRLSLALLVFFLSARVANGATVERVNVDLNQLGPALEYRASGFLHSITRNSPPDDLIAPLKPRLFRSRHIGADAGVFLLYPRMTRMGAAIQLVMSDGYTNYKPPWPGDGGDWSRWELHVTTLVKRVASERMTMQFDIWNEPDNEYFWKPSADQFLETWKRSFRLIRKLNPSVVVVGPSLSNRKSKRLSLEQFLLYAKANDCLPDVLSWHQWNTNLAASVDEVRKFMADNGIRINRISLNEIIPASQMFKPGVLPRYFAEIDRAKVESAAHACWDEGKGVVNCDNASLDGLLTHPGKQPRSTWHVYAAYGRMTGRVGTVTRSSTVDGLATADRDAVSILVGRLKTGKDPVELAIDFGKALEPLTFRGKIHVRAERIADSGPAALEAPNVTMNEDRDAGVAPLVIPLPDMGDNDAYFVTLTVPRTR